MPEPRDGSGIVPLIKKRWRGWLRAVHRDFGYLAVGFTLIYALSGIAINHISEWDPNFVSSERTIKAPPIALDAPDDVAIAQLTAVTGTGAPDDVFRAGDEIRLTYASGTQVTMIGDSVTVQAREPRFFFRVANWLHYNRGKAAWTLVADIYAVMLLYLAISGIFMIKGKLGLKWRGTILVGIGIAVPLLYVTLSGGPTKATRTAVAPSAPAAAPPGPSAPAAPASDEQPQVGSASPDDGFEMTPRAPAAPALDDGPQVGSASPDDGFEMKPRTP